MEGVCFWAIANGLGAHTDTLTSYEIGVQYQVSQSQFNTLQHHSLLSDMSQLFISTYVTWTTGTVCCKFSMLALYTSLFPSKRFRYAVWVMYGAVFVYYVFFLSFFMTQCHPISYGWNPVPGGYCKSVMLEEILSIALNMGLDTVIALLPMPLLWKVQMPFRNKLTISVMFAMGLLYGYPLSLLLHLVCNILTRRSVVGVMAWRMAITLMPSTQTDFVHGLYLVGLVSFMELWFSMIIVSLPTVAPLFRRYVEPFYKTLTGRSNSNTNPRRLKEAQHTIGSEPGQAKRSKSWQLEDGYLELDDTESGSKGHAEAWSGMSRASLIDASENTPSHAITK